MSDTTTTPYRVVQLPYTRLCTHRVLRWGSPYSPTARQCYCLAPTLHGLLAGPQTTPAPRCEAHMPVELKEAVNE